VPIKDIDVSQRYYKVGTKKAGNLLDDHLHLDRPMLLPMTQCPKCGQWLRDYDGMGVLAHDECGYCSHPSSMGGICDFCGEEIGK